MRTLFSICLRLLAVACDIERKVELSSTICLPAASYLRQSHDFICPMNIHVICFIFIIRDCNETRWRCYNNLLFKEATTLSFLPPTSKFGVPRYWHGYRWSNAETICLRHTAGTRACGYNYMENRFNRAKRFNSSYSHVFHWISSSDRP